jgi:hypothetical protein
VDSRDGLRPAFAGRSFGTHGIVLYRRTNTLAGSADFWCLHVYHTVYYRHIFVAASQLSWILVLRAHTDLLQWLPEKLQSGSLLTLDDKTRMRGCFVATASHGQTDIYCYRCRSNQKLLITDTML